MTTIFEKRREIGILMSMGATSFSVLKIFMLYGMIVGFGLHCRDIIGRSPVLYPVPMAAYSTSGDIYFINKLPVVIRTFDVLLVYFSANLIAWLTTIFPALKASKMLPAESIRYE